MLIFENIGKINPVLFIGSGTNVLIELFNFTQSLLFQSIVIESFFSSMILLIFVKEGIN